MIGNGNALDISNYQPAIPPAEAWKAEGVERVIVGCQRPDIARQQIATLRAAGIVVRAVYCYLYGKSGDAAEITNALTVAREFGIRRVWLDCEEEALTLDHIRGAVAAVQTTGLEPGIYTGAHFWRDHLGNPTEFAHLPLWMASYFWSGSILEAANFGGWSKATIHQYTTTGSRNDSAPGGTSPPLAGVSVDYDFDFEPLLIPQEDQVTDEEKEAWRQRRELALLSQDLDKYDPMKDVYAYAKAKGYVA